MKLICPHCQTQYDLAAALELQSARAALMSAMGLSGDLGRLMAHYIGLFKPAKRALSFDRAERLLAEIVPQIEGNVALRRGSEVPAPREVWIAALKQMLELRDNGKLELPLKTHGYLLEIVCASATRAASKHEQQIEQALRTGDRATAATLRAQYQDRYSNLQNDRRLGLINDEQLGERLAALKKEFGRE